MTKKRSILAAFLVGILVLVLCLIYVKFKTDAAIPVSIDENQLVYLQNDGNNIIESQRQRSGAVTNYSNISEQELMERSDLIIQANQIEEINQRFFGQNIARVNVNQQEIMLDDVIYSYRDQGDDTDSLRRYTFQGDESPISSENLTVLVTQAITNTEKRNDQIRRMTWRNSLLYIVFFTIGVLILFNLERVSIIWVQLFIKGAEAGPLFKILLGVAALILIILAFGALYLVVSSF